MSKSYDNSIYLSDNAKTIREKVKTMITDPARVKRSDPGHPDVCPVFQYHKVFAPSVTQKVRHECENALIGCVDCKMNLANELIDYLAPHHEKRLELLKKTDIVVNTLKQGKKKSQETAAKTMTEVREAMKI